MLCVSGLPCMADEVQFGIEQGLLGMTDAYRAAGDEAGLGDGMYRLSPDASISGDNELFGYQGWYSPVYTQYMRASDRSGFDHFAGANVDIRITPVDKVDIVFQIQDVQGNRTNILVNEDGGTELVNSDEGRTFYVLTNLRYEHSLSPKTQVIGRFLYQEYDYTSDENTDNRNLGVTAQIQHSWSRRLLLGANVSTNYTVFMRQDGSAFRYQTTFNPNAVIRYQLNPAWQIFASGGPSAIFTRQSELSGSLVSQFGSRLTEDQFHLYFRCRSIDSEKVLEGCPGATGPNSLPAGYLDDEVFVPLLTGPNAISGNTDQLTYFMQASIRRQTPDSVVEIAYSRSQDASQGTASSTLLDQVFLTAIGDFGEKWGWRINSGWNRRVSTYFQPIYFSFAQASPYQATIEGLPPEDSYIAEAKALGVQQVEAFYESAQVWAEGQVSRQISPKSRIVLRARYQRWLELNLTSGPQPTFDNFTAELSFDYYFDPFFF